jgi:TDG/mug DNA glycosylase family protein
VGPQDIMVDDSKLWVLPNPSGLNAHWTLSQLEEAFRELYERDQSSAAARI